MSKPARPFRFSTPRLLVLVALLELTGLAVATTYPPVDAVAPAVQQAARTTSQRVLRVGVEDLPQGRWPGEVRRDTEDSVDYALAEKIAAHLDRNVHFVKVDLAQRGRALEEGVIDVFVGRVAARPVPAGVDVFVSAYRAGPGVDMRTDSLPLSVAVAHADPALSVTVRKVLAGARQ